MTTPNNQNERFSLWATCKDNLPVIQWILMLVLAALFFSNDIGRSQTSQAAEVQTLQAGQIAIKQQIHDNKEADNKQIENVKENMLTKKEFEAHWKQIDLLRQDNKDMRILMEKMLENQNRRYP